MPDPHFDTQARACYWVTAKEWWYRLSFDVDRAPRLTGGALPDRRGRARRHLAERPVSGRDAKRLSRVSLPGGRRAARREDNVLLIRFQSIDQLLGGPRLDELDGWKERRTFLRKPQFNFGWDWALPLPSIGLTGPVWLELDNACRFVDFAVQPFVSGRVDFASRSAARQRGGLRDRLSRFRAWRADRAHDPRATPTSPMSHFTIPDPQLWWPNGYGAQPLYDYVDRLGRRAGGGRAPRPAGPARVAHRRAPFSEEAGPGISFKIEINGQRVFCKGGNWIPLELWPATAADEQYEFYLRRAQEANFNMLRVWGGGIYERGDLLRPVRRAGHHGLAGFHVRQRRLSGGAPARRDHRRGEYQVRRLRNHPCIVLWCGCNEDVYSWSYQGHAATATQSDTGVYSATDDAWAVDRLKDDPQIYSMILRGLVGLLGLGVPYIESSPQSRDDSGNHPSSGNCHISCWKYALFETDGQPERFREHFDQVCSFDSEFCIQGPCAVKTFKRFLAPSTSGRRTTPGSITSSAATPTCRTTSRPC